ncbi:MAG: HAD-IC family P-type ATPase, partial [candidate division WOR-3 bacterium]|nr:HAD-IC family P-type ATPase [candidate division WOR-3 bacterium]
MVSDSTDWTRRTPVETSKILETDLASGLTVEEAKKRLEEYGANRWVEDKRPNPLAMLGSQFVNPIILILVAALFVSGVILGEWLDAAAIGVILILNAVLGFVQEYRADRTLAALKKLASPRCRVMREGSIKEIDTEELVPGDVVLLAAGDKVPADGRLIDAKHILVDEASLTGESVAVDKQVTPLEAETRLLGEKRNMTFLGTSVVKGRGVFVVTATGKSTEMGKVASSLSAKKEETPLQKDLGKLGTKILFIVLGTCAVVFLVELFKQSAESNWLTPLLVAISLAVAAIPEGLPAAVTISLALGVRRMAERRAIVRRLHAVETLGSTSFICTDKTGTITENRMRVEKIIPLHQEDERGLLAAMLLCNDTQRSGKDELVGDPTETALVRFAEERGLVLEQMRQSCARVDELAFDSERKMMTTLHRSANGFVSMTKGAPENIIKRSVNLDEKQRMNWYRRCDELSQQGFRLLGFAKKDASQITADETLEEGMEFLGLAAESDPPRPEVPAALKECLDAGIRVAMITGDHMATAQAVAERVGLKGEALSGEELARMSDEELYDRVQDIGVYARISPLQKVKILKC